MSFGRCSASSMQSKLIQPSQSSGPSLGCVIRSGGKAADVLGATPEPACEYAAAGATFIGVGVDTILLAKATRALADFVQTKGGQYDC